ncbi:hypothetical protein MNBD_PLANCTO02-439 [hydrothermal vent metagenome]|uniref:Leucine Rich repeats (2 copies) n=1 Tax=hydrothermal vent metagenome TaxID=652676 RepID=A0A3B1DAJ4_9ZZZZ
MRLFIITFVVPLLLLAASGCGDSPQTAPGISRSGGNNNSNSSNRNGMSRSTSTVKKSTKKKPSLDIKQFQKIDKEEPESSSENNTKEPIEPKQVVASEEEKKRELTEEENRIIEALRAKGANVRVMDGYAFSILLNKENSFNDTDCPDLARLTKIQFLGLSGAKITDAGLERLSTLREVTSIMLDKTLITDEGIPSLQKMPKLAHINISETAITAEGRGRLQEAFPSTLLTSAALIAKTDEGTQEDDPEKPPVFPEGSLEDTIQKFVLTLKEGKTEGLEDYITEDANKALQSIRLNKVEERRMDYYKQMFQKVKVLKRPRFNKSKDRCTMSLQNEKMQILRFSCRKVNDEWKIYKFTIKGLEN